MSTATITKPATDKQIAFLNRLAGERDFDIPAIAQIIADANIGTASMRSVSVAIDTLMSKPRKPIAHEDGAAVSEGYYFVNGLIYKVQASKSTGNLYAKVFSEHGYEYAPGAMRLIPTATRLTLDQAAEAGVRTGRCVICAKELTDPDSVERGIGPVCAARV
uniref:Helix-turn-helix DNA binding domain protein n=2 Tax=unclassified bacterial viruses TaxID=12333 RepID=A0AAU7J802_9VIRU